MKPLRVLRGVAFWLSLAAFPVFAWPYLRPKSEEEEKRPPNVYAVIKVELDALIPHCVVLVKQGII